jgi:hypothetical protein
MSRVVIVPVRQPRAIVTSVVAPAVSPVVGADLLTELADPIFTELGDDLVTES